MPMSPGRRFGWEEAAKVKVLVSCAHDNHVMESGAGMMDATARDWLTFLAI
jgi:hypothetical protein